MRKIIYGSFVFALLASLGMTLFTLPASASEEFVAKMKPVPPQNLDSSFQGQCYAARRS